MRLFYAFILLCLPFVGITQSVTTYDRSTWTVNPSSEELTGDLPNGPAIKLLDGDNASFWVSGYTTNFTGYPYTLVFDMQVAQPVNQLYTVARANSGTSAYSGSVSFGDDGINFGTEIPVIFSAANAQTVINLPAIQNHRYFRITVTQNYDDHNAGANNEYITTLAEVGAIFNNTLDAGLTSFTVQAQAGGVKLDWSTSFEFNSTNYNITRSNDAVNFTTIGSLAATGTATTAATYTFTDAAPLTGFNFYRLELANSTGPATKSAIKNAEFPLITYSSSQPKNLNVFYFIPAGKAPWPDFKNRLDTLLINLQTYYKDEMQRNGINKSFGMVTDATHKKVNIIVVHGKYPISNYLSIGGGGTAAIQAEIDAYMADNPSPYYSSHSLMIAPVVGYDVATATIDEGVPVGGTGKNCHVIDNPELKWSWLGRDDSPESFNATYQIGAWAHEFGHAVGLPHNFLKVSEEPTLGTSLMSNGNSTFGRSTTSLTHTDAAILNHNQLFNDGSISYYGPNKASISSIHACYSASKNAIIVAGRVSTIGAQVTDVEIYNDPSNGSAPGVGDNNDYDAVAWTAPIIGTDSFYVEMPVTELQVRDSSLYQMRFRLVQLDGNLSDVRYNYDFANNIPELTDPAFTPIGATITASAGINGSISPSGATIINCAGNQTYTITPVPGASVQDVLVDGVSVGVVTTYTFTGVKVNHTISATFTAVVVNHTISASAGANGSISPNGSVSVANGTNKTFTITADPGYSVQNVVVDGISQGAIATYTFNNVTTAHTISASFTAVVVNYTITASAGSGGTISSSGATSVASGTNKTYTITSNAGFTIANVLVDGVSVGAVGTYTFTNVTAAHTISASFTAVVVNYTITASAGSGGTISSSGATSVPGGTNKTYTITANAGFTIANVLVDGVSVGAVGTYTFTNVTAAHTISASFTAVVVNYTITASAGAGGTISSSGATSVPGGTNKTYTITANAGFTIANVLVDGLSVGAVGTYTFTNVTAAHTISASFTAVVVNYTITASAGAGGTISSSGATSVPGGTNKTYTITANAGFTIANVLVDGLSVGAVGTYTFTNVTAAHTISASFAAVVVNYTITASAGSGGTISPNGATTVASGTNKTYTITANAGYAIASVLVDGVSQGVIGTYTFTNVTAVHTISATFTAVTTCTVPTLSGVITNINCKGSATGSINLTVTAGSSPYTYSWTGPNGFAKTTEDISALAAGTYNVKVTATGGCSKTASYIVTQPSSALTVSATAASVVCGSGTTSVTVTATGGTAPYTGAGVKTNQTTGSHTYTVTDSKGCTSSTTIVIASGTAPAAPSFIAGPSYNLCGGGKFVYIASAVPAAKSYTWTVPAGFSVLAGQGTCIALIKVPASFTQAIIKVSATNACGTSTQTSLTVYAVAGDLSSLITGPSNVTAGQKNTYLLPSCTGFTYTWTAPAGATITNGQGTNKVTIKSGSSNGYVKVTVRNACGTSTQSGKYVTVGNASNTKSMAAAEEVIVPASDFKAYPNPVLSNATVTFTSAKKDTKYEVKIVDINGRTLFTKPGLSVAGLNTLQLNMSRYVNGIYLLTLVTEDKTQTQKVLKNN